MAALDRSGLNASSLADLHAIADQIGLDGFRKLRKAELVEAILKRAGSASEEGSGAAPEGIADHGRADEAAAPPARRRRGVRSRGRAASEARAEPRASGAHGGRESAEAHGRPEQEAAGEEAKVAEGVVELLGNGSAFLRINPPEPSQEDVYISAAQVRRCELVAGDTVSGPVRTPRRSERYPSLIRIDTINGAAAEKVAEGTRYEELEVSYPAERLVLDTQDSTLEAIDRIAPIGLGSRALISGPARAGKSETLRRILAALAGNEALEVTLVLAGVRPEEIAEWQRGPLAPVSALTFAASAESQGQALERAIETAKRVAARGRDAIVLIDTLDGVHPHLARRALAAARNLSGGGSLTIIATATRPFGGESTVIALDAALAGAGRYPALDLLHSGTLRPELLLGEDGALAIAQARAQAGTER